MINNFHLLLSIGNTNKYQLPSKVIEYISLGKPVIHFAEIPSDPMYRFEKLFGNLKIINKEQQPSDINNYLKLFQNGTFDFNNDNFIENFPGSIYREDALFYKFDSAYKLAINSVVWKQQERTEVALKFYKNLMRYFPETKYHSQTTQMYETLENIKNNLTTKS